MKNNWFTIKKLRKNIWALAEFKHFEEVISYLVVGDKQALLIDTGMGIGDIKDAVSMITDNPVLVINSHSHFDHIGGNSQFKHIMIFRDEFSRLRAANGYSHEELLDVVDKQSFFKKPPNTFYADTFHIPPFDYKTVEDGEIITITPFQFKVVHTPGHSPDSICLYEINIHILFSGDTLYNGPIYLQLDESNIEDYKKSIRTIMKLPVKTIYAAHNEYTFDIKDVAKIAESLYLNTSKDVPVSNRIRVLLK